MESLDPFLLLKIFSFVDDLLICELVCKKWCNLIKENEYTMYKNACISNEWYPHEYYEIEDLNKEDLESINWKEEYKNTITKRYQIHKLLDQIVKYMNEKLPELNFKCSSNITTFKDIETKRLEARLPNDIKEYYRICNGFKYGYLGHEIHKYIPFSLNLSLHQFQYPDESDLEIFHDIVGDEYNPIIIGQPPDGEDYGETVWCDLGSGNLWFVTLNIPEFKSLGTIVDYLNKSVKKLSEFQKDD